MKNKQKILEKIVALFLDSQKKFILNKASIFGQNVSNFDKRNKINVSKFLKLNKGLDILTDKDLNEKLFLQFKASKRHDSIQEYRYVNEGYWYY